MAVRAKRFADRGFAVAIRHQRIHDARLQLTEANQAIARVVGIADLGEQCGRGHHAIL